MLQETLNERSTEEQDQLRCSTKKVKTMSEEGEVVDIPSAAELGVDPVSQSKPMDENPIQNRANHEDTQMHEAIQDGPSKVVKSLKWGSENSKAPSFKDKLLGINKEGAEKKEESRKPQEVRKQVEVDSEAFRPWMIPPRRPRRNFRKVEEELKDNSGTTEQPQGTPEENPEQPQEQVRDKVIPTRVDSQKETPHKQKKHVPSPNNQKKATISPIKNSGGIKNKVAVVNTIPSKGEIGSSKSSANISNEGGNPKQRKPPDLSLMSTSSG
ncbi:uncharacterized protein G2W53_036951 [Senna tora]|uniref:Uncharacterized protein n=1 Tax=Senna tora TaxID=362788 RepID=A0A834SVE5_9FABA|nr:uncharacterized protein G2W53_036951 [Senna tora]